MRVLALIAVVLLGACSPLETAGATCMPDGVHCPGGDSCGLWIPACDSPEPCPNGTDGRSVYVGNTAPLTCDGDRPTCPDGSTVVCVYVPDTGSLVPSECGAPASLCDL